VEGVDPEFGSSDDIDKPRDWPKGTTACDALGKGLSRQLGQDGDVLS
jgi:hypothetical protein